MISMATLVRLLAKSDTIIVQGGRSLTLRVAESC